MKYLMIGIIGLNSISAFAGFDCFIDVYTKKVGLSDLHASYHEHVYSLKECSDIALDYNQKKYHDGKSELTPSKLVVTHVASGVEQKKTQLIIKN